LLDNIDIRDPIVAEVYKLKASCEMAKLQHEEALMTLKFLIEQAFIYNDTETEVFVYEKNALCWFYLANIEKCKYYVSKGLKNLVEP
jgi:hypothetical protein